MPLLSNIVFDCFLILVVVTVVTQIVMPLAKRELTFPIFRKLVNKVSKPKKENNAAK